MLIHFHEPPPAQKIGGLDAAIASLRCALERAGHRIEMNPRAPGKADVAHFHGLWQRSFPRLARAYFATGVRCIVSPHGMIEPWAWRHKWWKKVIYWHLVEKRWLRRASAMLATADQEAARIAKFLPSTRVECLPLGMTGNARPDYDNARKDLGWHDGERVLLYLSRIHEKKGLELLLSALLDLAPWRGTRLIIVGPEEQPAYAQKCRAYTMRHADLLPTITWQGPVWGDARWAFLQGADLFCLPTHSENFGLVVLEACQVGTPVLTTTETPWASALQNGRGWITEPKVPCLRSALSEWRNRPVATKAQRTALSEWAWREYHWDVLVPRYAALYARR